MERSVSPETTGVHLQPGGILTNGVDRSAARDHDARSAVPALVRATNGSCGFASSIAPTRSSSVPR